MSERNGDRLIEVLGIVEDNVECLVCDIICYLQLHLHGCFILLHHHNTYVRITYLQYFCERAIRDNGNVRCYYQLQLNHITPNTSNLTTNRNSPYKHTIWITYKPLLHHTSITTIPNNIIPIITWLLILQILITTHHYTMITHITCFTYTVIIYHY
jgi:hypothetical protein